MKNSFILTLFSRKIGVLLLPIVFLFISCEKSSLRESDSMPIVVSKSVTKEEKAVIKFLAISLGIDSNKITIDRTGNQFVYLDASWNKTEIENIYASANVYKSIYEN